MMCSADRKIKKNIAFQEILMTKNIKYWISGLLILPLRLLGSKELILKRLLIAITVYDTTWKVSKLEEI